MSEINVSIVKKNKDKELFLRFPAKVYDDKHIMQDKIFEREVLENTNILCKGVKIIPLIAKNKKEEVVARCLLSFYEDDTAYIGFFECINNNEAAKELLAAGENLAREEGKKKILGPIDLSFWARYRFCTSEDLPYIGEPANKAYYQGLWEENGFKVSEEYISNFFDVADESFDSEKARKRLQSAKDEGYVFTHPNVDDFEKYLRDIYPVLIEGYKDFCGFKTISEEDFVKLYSPLKMVIDPEMVFLAYKDGDLKGFLICLPDYGNLLCKSRTPALLLSVMNVKSHAKRYVLLYMGVKRDCLGLGSALSQQVVDRLKEKKASGISALIHSGKASGGYFKDKIKEQRKYVMLEKML